jgi:hypothetical protein
VAVLLAASVLAAAPLPVSAGGSGAVVYVHVTTPANTIGSSTDLDNAATNNTPSAVVFATATLSPAGGRARTLDGHNIGTRWNAATNRWAIFNEDQAPMPIGAAFHVYALPFTPGTGGFISIHQATAANSSGDLTDIDTPDTNGQPGRSVLIEPNWNPGGVGGVSDAPVTGVRYDAGPGKWAIFHEAGSAVTPNASFTVYAVNPGTNGLLVHTATPANTRGGFLTCLDSPILNGNPNAIAVVTQNLTPSGVTAARNDHAIGLLYLRAAARWCIFNAGFAGITGAAFNVLAFNGPVPAPAAATAGWLRSVQTVLARL